MSKTRKISIILLAVIGFITTIKLALIYFDANFNPYSLGSFCSINNIIDCDSVAKTTFSQFLGIPLALWGMLLYVFVLFMTCVNKLKDFKYLKFLEVFKHPYSYIFSISVLSFSISMILACVQFFMIEKICILCFFTYILDFAIALISRNREENVFYDIKTSFVDFIEAVKIKKYAIAFSACVLVAIAFLTFTSMSYIFTPQVKKYNSFQSFKKMKKNPYMVSGNELGDPNSKIVIKEFMDYNCPSCYISNLMLHRAVSELDGVKIIQYNLPLDATCNPYVPRTIHENSCMLAKYAIAAKKQNKFLEMNEILFENTPETEDEIMKLAAKANIDAPQLFEDANSKEVAKQLRADIDLADEESIEGTPSVLINMEKHIGLIPYYELKDKLIKMGAKERK
ncbi:MAG: vitamin K epoxide reductase family protein [Candidatus Gastranaerophilales bacterium]|nr:vitamin K epoxide reductase family protein [Candidatus Gastranaerophilales bacterium]